MAVVGLALLALLAVEMRVPGTELARAVASRLLCAASMADGCGDEPTLIATYGDEVGRLVRRHMPAILLERGSRALPVDFRRCRATACGDGTARGLVHLTDAGAHVTAFVHVVDCRGGPLAAAPAEGDVAPPLAPTDCSGPRRGHLYIQYWLYYVDSATLRGVPIVGDAGYHRDDWESAQVRIGRDGVEERVSSHHGYNYARSVANAGSDLGFDPLREAAEALGARPEGGWGPETRLLIVSGGSHAGNAAGFLGNVDRIIPGRRVHLVPLEPIAAAQGDGYRFAVSPPWRKRVWRDPEASGTG